MAWYVLYIPDVYMAPGDRMSILPVLTSKSGGQDFLEVRDSNKISWTYPLHFHLEVRSLDEEDIQSEKQEIKFQQKRGMRSSNRKHRLTPVEKDQ